jgi:hypothetical protein
VQVSGTEAGQEMGTCVVVDPHGLSSCTGVITLDDKDDKDDKDDRVRPGELEGGTGTKPGTGPLTLHLDGAS